MFYLQFNKVDFGELSRLLIGELSILPSNTFTDTRKNYLDIGKCVSSVSLDMINSLVPMFVV